MTNCPTKRSEKSDIFAFASHPFLEKSAVFAIRATKQDFKVTGENGTLVLLFLPPYCTIKASVDSPFVANHVLTHPDPVLLMS